MPMKPASLAFLRDIGTSDAVIEILESDHPATITGDVLASYLRNAWRAGRYSARDAYTWHSVAELMGEPG